MQLTRDEVKKIARLARLALTEKEIDKFSQQLSEILSYAKILDEVDTSKVKPIDQITGLTHVLFEDKVSASENSEELLAQSPQKVENGMIKIRSIF